MLAQSPRTIAVWTGCVNIFCWSTQRRRLGKLSFQHWPDAKSRSGNICPLLAAIPLKLPGKPPNVNGKTLKRSMLIFEPFMRISARVGRAIVMCRINWPNSLSNICRPVRMVVLSACCAIRTTDTTGLRIYGNPRACNISVMRITEREC